MFAAMTWGSQAWARSEPRFTESRYPAETMIDREFTSADMLEIDTSDLDIYVKESSNGRIHVEIFVAGPDHDRAVEYFEKHLRPEVEQDGKTVVIRTNEPSYNHSWGWDDFWRQYRNVRAWAVISAPAATSAEMDIEDGDLRIDHLERNVSVRAEDGDVEVGRLIGDRIVFRTEDGDLKLEGLEGGDVDLVTEDGDIHCKTLKGDRVSVSSEDGNIELGRVDAKWISIDSEDGDIEVRAAGDELKASCQDGDISVELLGPMAVALESDDGDIDLTIPENLDADLDLQGDDVHVRGSIKVDGRVSSSYVRGAINGGGKPVRARSSDGDIRVSLYQPRER